MSDKTRGSGPDEHLHDEIRENFEAIHGSTEDFSKRAVGSLFDEPEPAEAEAKPAPTSRLVPDPEKQYAEYIQTAQADMRREQERNRAAKEKAIKERDEQLDELTEISRRKTAVPRKKPADAEEHEGHTEARHPTRTMPPINVRNVASVAIFLVLIIFVVLVWQINSTRSRLAAANDQIAALQQQVVGLNSQRTEDVGRISSLEAERDRLLAAQSPNEPETTTPDPDAPYDEDTTEPDTDTDTATTVPGDRPHTVVDTITGNRLYTVQPRDTFWSIAVAFYGNGQRHTDILAANNMRVEDLRYGMTIIIPD